MKREYLYVTGLDGKEIFVEDNGIAALWDAEIIFPLSVKALSGEKFLALHVNCNDVFWWACADAEVLSSGDIEELYNFCFDTEGNRKKWGSIIWVCLKRGMRPQHPIEDDMKKEGAWTEELEALPIRGNTG